AGPPIQPIFSRAGSTYMTKHSCKVLLGFEAAGDCDIQYTPLRRAQHLLGTLDSVAQYKLMRCFACRLAKHSRKMSWTQLHRFCNPPKSKLVFHLGMHQLFNHSQARRTQSPSERLHGMAPTCVGIDQRGGKCLFNKIQKQWPTWEPRHSLRIC